MWLFGLIILFVRVSSCVCRANNYHIILIIQSLLTTWHWRHISSIEFQSSTSRLFVQQLTEANSKENGKIHVSDPLWGNLLVTNGFPSQKVSNAESVFLSWRRHNQKTSCVSIRCMLNCITMFFFQIICSWAQIVSGCARVLFCTYITRDFSDIDFMFSSRHDYLFLDND